MERVEACPAHHVFQVRAGKAFGLRSYIDQIDVVSQRHVLRMNSQDLFATALVGCSDINQFVEAARAQQRRIDQSGTIGRTNHHHRLQFFEPVHFGQNGIHHPPGHLGFALPASTCRNQTVDLVDKHDAGRDSPGPFEHPCDLLFAFAIPFG